MSVKTRTLLAASFAALAIGLLVIFVVSSGRSFAYPPLPSPNGYDDFIRAATLITGDIGNYQNMGSAQLKDLLSSNEQALQLVHLGLTRRCSVPTEQAITNISAMVGQLSNTKRVAQLLRAEGRLAELENRPEEAGKAYIEGLRFGNETSRGGILIHRLVSIACEAIAGIPLAKLADNLSCEQARLIVPELERLDRERVSFEEIRRLEKRFAYHELLKLGNPIQISSGWWQGRAVVRQCEMRHNTVAAHERLILVELALRCYEADQGNAPTNLDQLVPKYLSRLPLDPFNRQAFHYKLTSGQGLVYSVGPDGVDDGGKPMNRGFGFGAGTQGDITYNSSW